jgi:hypothetical protein
MEKQIETAGFAIIENGIDDNTARALLDQLQGGEPGDASRNRKGSTFGVRNLLRDRPIIHGLTDSPAIRRLIEPVVGPNALAVRGILFDKTPGANWTVPWHQDLSIAVTEKHEVPGYGPWSVKAGVPHVQPPVSVLQNMLTVRLHLDDCGADNGPLLVIPGSHAHGVLSPAAVEEFRSSGETVKCIVNRGGAVLMRPLLLHASHSAASPAHRRVVHLEFAAANILPVPLQWYVA